VRGREGEGERGGEEIGRKTGAGKRGKEYIFLYFI